MSALFFPSPCQDPSLRNHHLQPGLHHRLPTSILQPLPTSKPFSTVFRMITSLAGYTQLYIGPKPKSLPLVLCHLTFPLFTMIQLYCHLSVSRTHQAPFHLRAFVPPVTFSWNALPPLLTSCPLDLSLHVTSSERPTVTRFSSPCLSVICYHSNLLISSCDIIRRLFICLLSVPSSII